MIDQYEIEMREYKRGYHLVTSDILKQLPSLPEKGMMNILIKHTSAGLTLNENADYSVRDDFETVIDGLVPEGDPEYTHVLEGEDDMPAHIKSSLMGATITIPITNHRLNLGTWQGIYLCEFRNHGGRRKLVVTIYS
ncbi:secondary thiamine-phosphate synthase enzyme YjbQ [Carboxylicivirga linearis]|uniref:Secondary thiamine-phosphate synthase enzyme YjbQ n=1 Tax=Carboxylicivirga linearis TaxID=1628157 RepID=A0ABS5JZ41_9BACT|nr:secondary thiamine-phosphate synthase enzyme YjbQ [Carboxylicivirga linearis]MBS2100182.1 secondary thiamine-phosphate synthase enzyme YjbQ [Carboxylicivirga linearis]